MQQQPVTLEDVVTNCPISVDNPMSGQLVTTVLLCNAPVDAEKCPAQNDDLSPTDLPGVYTMMPSQCNIDYPVCDSTTPLGIALELGVTEEVEVVDDVICQLDIPILMECIDSGFLVNNPVNCPQKCPDGTYIMQGMVCPDVPTTLNVIKETPGCFEVDSEGSVEIDEDCSDFISILAIDDFEPNLFNITVTGNNVNQSNFLGSSEGVLVSLDSGSFNVSETVLLEGQEDEIIPITSQVPPECDDNLGDEFGPFNGGAEVEEDIFLCSVFSDECSGNINLGDNLVCTIENFLLSTAITTLNIVKETPEPSCFVTIGEPGSGPLIPCIDSEVNLPIFDDFAPNLFNITVTGNNVNQSNFLGSSEGVLVSLESGSFEVSEEVLFGLIPGDSVPIPQIPEDQVPDECDLISEELNEVGPFNAGVEVESIFFCAVYSDECSGNINLGDNLVCTIENFLLAELVL